MINLPKISSDTKYITSYAPSVFMLFDSESGPNEITSLYNKIQLYQYFNSYNKSDSYNIALKLLDNNIPIEVLRVKSDNYHSSIGICNDGDLCYPVYGNSYSNYEFTEVNTTGDTNTITIKFNELIDPYKSNLVFPMSNYNLVMWTLKNNDIKYPGLHLTKSNVIYVSKDRTNWEYEVNTDKIKICKRNTLFIIEDFINTLVGRYGIQYEKIDDYTYTFFNYIKFSSNLMGTSIESTSIDKKVQNDIETRIKFYKTPLIFYSKYDDSIDDINIDISKQSGYYVIQASRLDKDNNVLYSELFYTVLDDDSSDLYITTLINNSSTLITCEFYPDKLLEDTDLTGSYTLLGVSQTLADTSDFISTCNKITQDEADNVVSVYVIDSQIYDNTYQRLLFSKLISQNIARVFLYNFTGTILKSNTNIAFFNYDYIDETDNIIYPSYLLFLFLASKATWEGDVTGNIRLLNYSGSELYVETTENEIIDKDTNLLINIPSYDGYKYQLDNPIGYLLGDKISLRTLCAYCILCNYVSTYLEFNPGNYNKYNVTLMIDNIMSDISKLVNYDYLYSVDEVNVLDDTITITMRLVLTYYMSKNITISINITRIIGE